MKNEHPPAQEFSILDGGRLFIALTHARDVVAVEGSVLGGPNMLPIEFDIVPGLTAELLDAGTAKKNKSVIREALAARGISLSFSSSGDRTTFSGRCFPEDLPTLLATISECLREAHFPESEVKNAKARALGVLAEEKSDTRAQAERAFSALLYDPRHVNYVRPIADMEKSVPAVRRAQLQSFRKMLGKGGFVLAITGDVEVASVRAAVGKAFRTIGAGTVTAPVKQANKKNPVATEKLIPIADKANIDVLLGAALPLTVHDQLYHPMKVLTEMLGGGFASHLMQTIRERDGLTYGVYARLSGFDAGATGSFKIWATFSPDRYGESVAKLRTEVNSFFSRGLTDAALLKKKEEIIGSYLIALSTTQNLANTLHVIGTLGFDLSYLTEYPAIIRAVSLADITHAADLIPHGRLSLAASGSFKKP